jgi:hypothetical protein
MDNLNENISSSIVFKTDGFNSPIVQQTPKTFSNQQNFNNFNTQQTPKNEINQQNTMVNKA